MRKIIKTENIERFEPNRIVRLLLDTGKINLNEIWVMYGNDLFTIDELKEFYQLIGYTVSGYDEIFGGK